MPTDPSIEAKLQRMMKEIQQGKSLAKTRSGSVSEQQKLKPPIQHRLLDWKTRFFLPIEILMFPWAQFIISQVFFQGQWDFIVIPRQIAGIPGIFLSAFSHASWVHLIGNSIAFAIFSWFVLLKSQKDFWITFIIGWLGGGLACWLLGLQNVHGLSGVVYTLFGYLLFIGWLEKRFLPLALSVFVIINFSYCIWGVFPTDPTVAWWGHLFGFLLGVFSAYAIYREPSVKN